MTKSEHFHTTPRNKNELLRKSTKFIPRIKLSRPSKKIFYSEQEISKGPPAGSSSSEMKESLVIAKFELQQDVNKMANNYLTVENKEIYSDDDTQYLTMINEENLREDSRTFFDNEIDGEDN